MSERLENILVRLLHGAVLAVTAWSILSIDFTGRGRLIDQLRGQKETAVAERNGLEAPTKAKLSGAGSQDRLMVEGQVDEGDAAQQKGVTAAELAAQVPTVDAAQADAPKRLKTKLTALNDPSRMASQQTAARAPSQPAYIEASAVAAPTAMGVTYSFEPPAEDQPQRRAVASRYGGSGRADMMGKAAGPVYNISGKKK